MANFEGVAAAIIYTMELHHVPVCWLFFRRIAVNIHRESRRGKLSCKCCVRARAAVCLYLFSNILMLAPLFFFAQSKLMQYSFHQGFNIFSPPEKNSSRTDTHQKDIKSWPFILGKGTEQTSALFPEKLEIAAGESIARGAAQKISYTFRWKHLPQQQTFLSLTRLSSEATWCDEKQWWSALLPASLCCSWAEASECFFPRGPRHTGTILWFSSLTRSLAEMWNIA